MDHPIVLAKFDVASQWNTWLSYTAGIWYADFSGAYPLVDPELLEGVPTRLFDSDIMLVLADGVELTPVDSFAELYTLPSFHWDRETRILYVHLEDANPPPADTRIGIGVHVASEFYDDGDGNVWLPHLKDLPPLAQEKDRLFFKKVTTATWNMTLDNSDLTYDGLPEWGAYNRKVQYYIGEAGDPFSSFSPLRSGRVKGLSFRGSEVVLQIQDVRAQFSAKLPERTFTMAEYADLAPDLSGTLKPMGFGRIFAAVPVCLNAQDAVGPYEFMFCDGFYAPAHSVEEVRVNGSAITPTSIDLAAGTVTLTAAQVKSGDTFLPVEVDFQGYEEGGELVENPLDVARLILDWAAGYSYSDATYNTTRWVREWAGKPAVALYVTSESQALSLIGKLMEATRGGLLVDPDGRLTWKTPNYGARPTWNITEWYQTPEIEFDPNEVLAFARVGYRKRESSNKSYRYATNEDYRTQVFNSFNIVDSEEFLPPLVDEADAEDLAEQVMFLSHDVAELVTGIVPLDFYGIAAGDTVQMTVNRFVNGAERTWRGVLRGEVLRVAPDILAGHIELTVRVIPGIPEYVEGAGMSAIYGLGVYGTSVYGG